MTAPRFTLTGLVLDAPDANALAAFYQQLLGWTVGKEERGWVVLRPPDGIGAHLAFQSEPEYVAPTWPSTRAEQQMMTHLDIEVDDLETAGARVLELGAVLAGYQPQEHVRVYLDPVGHPFCLWVGV